MVLNQNPKSLAQSPELHFPASLLVPTCTQSAIITPATNNHSSPIHRLIISLHKCLFL